MPAKVKKTKDRPEVAIRRVPVLCENSLWETGRHMDFRSFNSPDWNYSEAERMLAKLFSLMQ